MPWASRLSRLAKKRRGVWPWVLALLLFAASLGVRISLSNWLDPLKFLTFYPAIAASALLCGWPQGVFVLVLSALSAWFLFFEPFNSFALKDANSTVAIIGFLLVGGFIVLLMAVMIDLVRGLEDARRVQESLFRELQHRVANNLQIVVAMLTKARRGLRDSAAAVAIIEAEERIMAMSHLHRRLHDGSAYADGLEPILREVASDALRDLPVDVAVEVAPDANLSLDQMTALILLVNEAATNAAKHVFHKGRGTRFEVCLRANGHGRFELIIHDDGPGIDASATAEPQGSSLGMSIMQAFAGQLGGSLQVLGALALL